MKKLLLIFALLCASAEAQILQQVMQKAPSGGTSVAYVSDVQGSTFNNVAGNIATPALSVTTGNNLIGFCGVISAGVNFTTSSTFSDTAGNTFTKVAGATVDLGGGSQIITFESFNVTGNASDVGTCTLLPGGATGFVGARMFQFSGGTKVHDTSTNGQFPIGSGPYSAFTTSAFSTALASEGIACFLWTNFSTTSMTFTAGGTYTKTTHADTSGGSSAEYNVFSSTQSGVTASMTSSATTTEGVIACDVIK